MNAPFKFLDAYQKDELDVFFGRDKDTERLYNALSGVKHLLVYGPSGAGKTSLIECGLRNQFSDADWLAITVRRGYNLISSVFETLNAALRHKFPINPETRLPEDPEFDFGDAVERLYAEQYKPVYLLFDQFEELLIQADDDEKIEFFIRLNRLIRYKTPCRMLLILREEFIGHFSDYESLCPSIFQHRFRLEKMSRSNVHEVISSLLIAPRYSRAFQVKDAEGLTDKILERLPDKQKEIEPTHIQVFLSELWDRAAEHASEIPVLSPELVQDKDNLETVLVSFLEKQRKALDAVYGDNVSLELLVTMITERNTKLQVSPGELKKELAGKRIVLKHPLKQLLLDLEQRKIIRTLKSGDQIQYEISHDVLAKVVGENLSEDMKQRRRAKEIADVYHAKEGYLSREDLDLLRPFLSHLPANMRERMQMSELELTRMAKAEVDRNRRRVALLSGLLVLALIGLGFAWWQYSISRNTANAAQLAARHAYANDLAYKSQIALKEGDRTTAFQIATFAHRYAEVDNPNVTRALVEALYYNDVPDHQPLPWSLSLQGHTFGVSSVAFSPDGKRLATGSYDGSAKIWDLTSGKQILSLQGHTDPVLSVAFSPSGRRLATGSYDRSAKIWDLASGKQIFSLQGHTSSVESVAFSPDGKRLATGSGDYSTKIWDLVSGKQILSLQGHTSEVFSVAFSPDGKRLATGSGFPDNSAQIWDLASGKQILSLQGQTLPVRSVAFSPDGKRLATGSDDWSAKIWDLASGKQILSLQGHIYLVWSVAFSPDGKRLATGSFDKSAKIWDLDSGRQILSLQGHTSEVLSVAFSPDGKRLATGSGDKSAKIWDLASGKQILSLREHTSSVESVAFSPDGKRLATGSGFPDNSAQIWDLASGKQILSLEGHRNYTCVAFSPDGKRLATGSGFPDNSAQIWDLASGKQILSLRGHTGFVESVAFSPDGKRLATGSFDKSAKIWDLVTGKQILSLQEHTSEVLSVAFSPDGKRLATGSGYDSAKIWDLVTGKQILSLRGYTGFVESVAFSPDGKRLATGSRQEEEVTESEGQSAKIWDMVTGKQILSLQGYASTVLGVAFSPDGKRLATGSDDGSAKIWDLVTGKQILSLQGYTDAILSVAFSPDGKRLATGDINAKIWDFSPEGWRSTPQGKNRLLSGLDATQLASYNLESLLDLHPDNESKLIATREVWQIKAFADLAAAQASGSNVLSSVKAPYARANRLYAAALGLQDEPLIRMDWAAMLRRWAAVYRGDGKEAKAKELEAKADGLWKKEER